MKIHHLAFMALGGLLFAACTSTGPAAATPTPQAVGSPPVLTLAKTVLLEEQSKLGQSGKAVITEGPEGNAVVTLTLTGGTFPDPQPAHIHLGACPSPGAVKYPLTNVVNGSSVTTLDASYEDLVDNSEPLAVNIHKSEKEPKVYTACGDMFVLE